MGSLGAFNRGARRVDLLDARNVRESYMTDLGKVAYDGFVRETGYAKDARVPEFSKQPTYIQARWRKIADDIIAAWKKDALVNDKPRRKSAKPRHAV